MRSFGNVRWCDGATVRGCAVFLLAGALTAGVRAQSAEELYNQELAREAQLRQELDLAPQLRAEPPRAATAALLTRVRATVAGYEAIVKRFPRSGYSDNALWQGAMLSADAFWQFGDARDKTAALRLFGRLVAEYSSSSLVMQVEAHTRRLAAVQPASPLSTLKAIRRDVLPDAIRITLELEHEAMFREERLDGPPRVFVDLQNTRAAPALKDATIPFPDDVVRQARVGRQLDNRTRVVLDLESPVRYSVYSLYNPYRLVLDFERAPTSAKRIAPTGVSGIAPTSARGNAPTNGSGIAPPAANAVGGFSLSRQLGLRVARVVIDPGHGGHDPGAQMKDLNEAEIVLDVALRLEQLLLREQGVEVVLTRRSNVYVPLEERTAIANRAGADLFLSIHINASAEPEARGVETYFLNFAPNSAAEAIAARENAGSARTMGSLPDIVKAIALNNKIDESRDFASMVQASMYERLRKVDRNTRSLGVKQAPFMVLIGATMPGVLVEMSFLTNRQEAGLLRTQSYRQQLAEALFNGIQKYQKTLKADAAAAVLRSGF
jgi:N-acetylmuramoyl-L-alanine amidase